MARMTRSENFNVRTALQRELPQHEPPMSLAYVAQLVGYTGKLNGLAKMVNGLDGWIVVAGMVQRSFMASTNYGRFVQRPQAEKNIIFGAPNHTRSCIPSDFGTLPLATRIEWLGNELVAFAEALSAMRDEVVRLKRLEALAKAFMETNGKEEENPK